jgi:probable addiction module antidote protein
MNRSFNSLNYLGSEKAIAGYMDEARQEGAEGFMDALDTIAKARLVNQLAESTGIDREQLCGMFSGHPDEATMDAIAKAMAAPLAVG